MVRKVLIAICLFGHPLVAQPILADTPSGQMLGNTCVGCHGPNGESKGAAPSIKGTPADRMIQAMQDFKTAKRPATIMDRIAKGYSDDEIKAMAEYFASLK